MYILLVEDHRDIAENICDYCEDHDHNVDLAMDGQTALTLIERSPYDVLIIDVVLPRMDGLTLVNTLREKGHSTPILMLTARDSLEDKLAGFAAGADDYLVKPFALPELLARLLALSRRPGDRPNEEAVTIADLTVDPREHRVVRSQKELRLNRSCFILLHTLAMASPRPVSQKELTLALWDSDDQPGSDNALRSHLYLLRQVIDKPFPTALIHTIRGVGVMLGERS